ncbi:MAG: RNA degradosome polyphosphate kinase, partial [Gammaproteobacteria bacterium]
MKGAGSETVIFDLDSPEWYLNRELTWLEFNRRVLHEAQDPRNPLLERVKFLAIMSSNLDEFFMKRLGGLKQQVGAGVHEHSADGRTPSEQIAVCHEMVRAMKTDQLRLAKLLRRDLAEHGIRISRYFELSQDEQARMRDYYFENIYPLVTPIVMDPAHPFPFISNLSLNL